MERAMGLRDGAFRFAYKRLCQPFLRKLEDLTATQEECLRKILKRCKDTVFGKQHGFADIKTVADYQRIVPVSTYEDMKPYIARCMEGEQNVLFPDKIVGFITSSGTTGAKKYYPLGEYKVRRFVSETARRGLFYIIHGNHFDLFDGATLALHPPPTSGETYGVYDVIAGVYIAARSLRPKGLEGTEIGQSRRVVPPQEVNAMSDWGEKIYLAARYAVAADVRMTVGVTSLMVSLLRNISLHFHDRLLADPELDSETKAKIRRVSKDNVINLRELWPNFTIFGAGGTSVTPYRRIIRELLGDVEIWDVYATVETTVGSQIYPNEGIVPEIDRTFFEFQPDEEGAEPLTLREVEVETPYRILITNNAGFYRYEIGDLVTFRGLNPPVFGEITRIKTLANIVGERTREEMILRALDSACEKQSTSFTEFALLPEITVEITRYHLYVEFTQVPSDLEEFTSAVDSHLRSLEIYYDYFRKNNALSPPLIIPVEPGGFGMLLRQLGKDPLHSKVPRLLTPDLSRLLPRQSV
jgi:hypothetical protein